MIYGTLGLASTTLINLKYWKLLSGPFKAMGTVVGLGLGATFGLLKNTEYLSKRLSVLGSDYELGRYVVEDLSETKTQTE